MLYYAGALQRMGNVDSGDTAMDYLPAERERGITINSAAISFEWRSTGLFLVDSPGHLDFTYEVQRSVRVMDAVVVVLDSVAGVQPQTETVWRQAESYSLPRIVFVNKMDRDGADFPAAVSSLRQRFGVATLSLHWPLVDPRSGDWLGFVDLVSLERVDRAQPSGLGPIHALRGSCENDSRPTRKEHRVALDPQSLDAGVARAREELVEGLAEVDDDIMEAFVAGEDIAASRLKNALHRATVARSVVPVLCGSALKNTGVQALIDAIVDYLPSPEDRATIDVTSERPVRKDGDLLALAFKVTHDKHRGRMVYLRAFCGGLDHQGNLPLFNVSNGCKELPTSLLRVMADDTIDAGRISTGDIFAAVGMKHTRTGDTISSCRPKTKKTDLRKEGSITPLEGISSPPAVISVAVEAESTSQQRQLDVALRDLLIEDPSLQLSTDPHSGETLLSGMGQLHLDIVVDRLSQSLPDPIYVSKPRVAYRETIRSKASHVEHYDRIIGATRQRATLRITLVPIPSSSEPGEGEESNNVILPESLDTHDEELGAALRNGVLNALKRGPLLGAPSSRVEAIITSPVEELKDASNRAALLACTNSAVQEALSQANPVLLEPLMMVMCTVPDSAMGTVIGELTHPTVRRGVVDDVERVNATEANEGLARIRAHVPLAGMVDWATRQRSLTKGRGDFSMEFASYHEVGDAHQSSVVCANRSGDSEIVGG